MATQPAQPAAPGGVISADEAYSLDNLKQDFSLGTAAIRTARKKGLPVKKIGRKSYVMGKDLLQYLDEHATTVA